MKSLFRSAISVAAGCCLAVSAWASPDADALAARLEALDGFAATFRQVVAGARGQILEESSGYVLLKRPGFKWVVDDPYPQIIVTRGDVLKVYDPDLEQLTIRPLNDALSDTPVSLLTGSQLALDETFHVQALSEGSGDEAMTTFVIVPVGEDSLFAEIRMTFSDSALRSLGIADHLGQYTEIRFRSDPGRVIQSADFELEVPPETDVIGG